MEGKSFSTSKSTRRAKKILRHLCSPPVTMENCNGTDEKSESGSSYTYTYTYEGSSLAAGDQEVEEIDGNDAKFTAESQTLYDSDGGRREPTHWDGWGYSDTKFQLLENMEITLTGSRYQHLFDGKHGKRKFPEFVDWALGRLGLDPSEKLSAVDTPPKGLFQPPFVPQNFLNTLSKKCALDVVPFAADKGAESESSSSSPLGIMPMLLDGPSRLRRSHGHTLGEIYRIRIADPEAYRNIPDAVMLPQTQEQVEAIVEAAKLCGNITIIPFGGGTTVTEAVCVPTLPLPNERKRSIICVDMKRMNRILWVDQTNMTACVQAGILGLDLENQLGTQGLTMGHEPDSLEFSTLGGWIATNSSGMKKNRYGNIDDIVLSIEMVTAAGTMKQQYTVERQAVGPRMNRLSIGSEGCLGIVVSAIVRLHRKPVATSYGSMVFPNFEQGVHAMREIALHRAAPASVRLMDNTQFEMGQKLKPESSKSLLTQYLAEKGKHAYLTGYHGLNPDKLCAMTLLFEGTHTQVNMQQKMVREICSKHGGVLGDATSGLRGYNLTWMIAYLRDFGVSYRFMSESFETSVEWGRVVELYDAVIAYVKRACLELNVDSEPLVGGRVTQTYDSCAVIYFYFGFMNTGLADPLKTFETVEHGARAVILNHGGSLSHHHGVGKLRKAFVPQVFSAEERKAFQVLKDQLDPTNVFGAGNFVWNGNT